MGLGQATQTPWRTGGISYFFSFSNKYLPNNFDKKKIACPDFVVHIPLSLEVLP